MLDTIRRGYRRFGFPLIETPVFEQTEVLLTKSGGETERQIYFVQSAGSRQQGDEPDLALRFDLTVPLARYVAEHEQDLVFPFRRSQIQRVYRGERPQRGRYREFYQCDIDVIDREHLSLRHDAEIAAAVVSILTDLDIGKVTVRINNRRLMRGLLAGLGVTDEAAQTAALREIDKLERQGRAAVEKGLASGGFEPAAVSRLLELTETRVSGPAAVLDSLDRLGDSGGNDGAGELAEVVETMRAMGVPEESYALDLSIARGLDYYTGTVYETTLDDHPELGSICSGGRYDDLADQYTTTRLPGVGISIGFTRLFWQLREAGILPQGAPPVQVSVTLLDDNDLDYTLAVAARLRSAGVSTETQMVPDKLGKQLKAADRRGTLVAVIAGAKERERGTVALKHLRSGDQTEVSLERVIDEVDRLMRRPG